MPGYTGDAARRSARARCASSFARMPQRHRGAAPISAMMPTPQCSAMRRANLRLACDMAGAVTWQRRATAFRLPCIFATASENVMPTAASILAKNRGVE
jgi:hypothetical protein